MYRQILYGWRVKMRSYAALITTVLLLSGCSGVDKFFDDTVSLPGSNPEAPDGYAENMQRVKGNVAIATTPLLPQSENIWPSRPPALPTLNDVANDDHGFNLSDYSKAAGGDVESVTHDQNNKNGNIPVDFPEDGNLNVGEQYQIKHGMIDYFNGRLPDSIKDQGAKYIEENTNPVIVPNGDGTNTVIDAKGVVRILPDSQLPHSKKTNPATQKLSNKK